MAAGAATGAGAAIGLAGAACTEGLDRRGVNHQAVCPFDSGLTAATSSMPGPTAKDSSRGTPSAAPRVRR